MDLIALYNTLQKLITPESSTSLKHAAAELLWTNSLKLEEGANEHSAAVMKSVSEDREGNMLMVFFIRVKLQLERVRKAGVMSRRRADSDDLSHCHFF